ncbi:enoyl-CoA hydratase/isomerase family protein [Puia dinghuensis]|uniref:Enoyl-CoA hydratase n=1 Tax=Puia dinghuensis TaxID=1792502 RepID=A0A8J2UGK4_9BACT|nr:enoyl-CoA hydratase-related protein [Puia dinghuensis]GGB14469.1 enoyl-CoA hydratase [Puia dinghuensis]
MYKTLHTDLTDGILTVTINRPDKLNAINKDVMNDLGEVVGEIYKNEDIRSAIITGAGPKAFVAGADISEFLGLTKEQGQALSAKGHDIFFRIASCPKPIAAAINGFALGGGLELAMACHFRLCTTNARFGQPEVNLGLIPGYGGTQRLVQLVGKGRAIEIMLSARMVDATEAHTMGLVNYIVTEPNELLTKTRELLSIINEKAPIAVARIIECANIAAGDGVFFGSSAVWEADPFGGQSAGEMRTDDGALVRNGFLREQEAFGECFGTADMKEGAKAFLEKRKAVFTGK